MSARSDRSPTTAVPEAGPREMIKADIWNVELLQFAGLDGIMVDLIDVSEVQHEMEDLSCRWNLGPVDPESFDVGEQESFKSRDVVAFRSKRR